MRRSRPMIILQILSVCDSGANKTRIVYNANLNFKIVNYYIDLLTTKGLIAAKQESPKYYETTQRGRDLLKSLKLIDRELNGV
jgi:predicted transcriptional regulator